MLYVNPLGVGNVDRINAIKDPQKKEKLALQEFEHLFLFTLLQEMRKTIPLLKETEGGQEKDLYTEMLDDALSGQMARSGQMGIAKQIEEQLRTAETQNQVRKTFAERQLQTRQAAPVKALGVASDK